MGGRLWREIEQEGDGGEGGEGHPAYRPDEER